MLAPTGKSRRFPRRGASRSARVHGTAFAGGGKPRPYGGIPRIRAVGPIIDRPPGAPGKRGRAMLAPTGRGRRFPRRGASRSARGYCTAFAGGGKPRPYGRTDERTNHRPASPQNGKLKAPSPSPGASSLPAPSRPAADAASRRRSWTSCPGTARTSPQAAF